MSAAALSGQAFEFYCAICGEKTAVTLGKRASLRRSHIQSGKFACADCRAHINEVRAKVSESGLDASAWAHENAALVGDTSHHMEVFYGRAAGDRFECPLCLSRGSYTIGFRKPVGLDMHLDRCGVREWMVREEYEMDERRRVQAAADDAVTAYESRRRSANLSANGGHK